MASFRLIKATSFAFERFGSSEPPTCLEADIYISRYQTLATGPELSATGHSGGSCAVNVETDAIKSRKKLITGRKRHIWSSFRSTNESWRVHKKMGCSFTRSVLGVALSDVN